MPQRIPFLDTPIVLAPLGGPGTAELTAAVCNAGAFGFLPCAYFDPERITSEIARVRALTNRPFGVNLFIEPPLPPIDEAVLQSAHERLRRYRDELGIEHSVKATRPPEYYEAQIEAVLRARPAAFSFVFGIPEQRIIEAFGDAGVYTIGTATSVREAKIIQDAGIDAVIAQGAEAGGHRGTFAHDVATGLTGTFELVKQVADAVSIPVVATGGIMTGGGVAAAIALGASAAQLGTAFLLADEAGTVPAYRAALQRQSGEPVLTSVFSGRTARGLRNRFIEELSGDNAVAPYPYQNTLTRDIRNAAGRAGRAEYLSMWAGEGYRMARTGPAAAIVAALINEMHGAAQDVADFCGA